MEYAAAKSSICRQCGRSFSPFAPKPGLKLRTIEGRLRGNLHCDDTATINYSGKIPGRISARHIVLDRRADIHCFRRVRAESIEIKGRMSGEIIAQTVTVHKKGSLEGDVTARAI